MCDTCQNRKYSACFLEAFILFYQNVILTLLFLQMGDGNLLALNTYKYRCGVETVERMLPSWIFQILILRTSEYSKYWDDRETCDTCCRLLPGSYTEIWIFHISIVTRVPHLWLRYCDEYRVDIWILLVKCRHTTIVLNILGCLCVKIFTDKQIQGSLQAKCRGKAHIVLCIHLSIDVKIEEA